jgi:hypothetical protein
MPRTAAAQKKVIAALRSIVGARAARDVMEKVGIADDRRVGELTEQEILQVMEILERDYEMTGAMMAGWIEHVWFPSSQLAACLSATQFDVAGFKVVKRKRVTASVRHK